MVKNKKFRDYINESITIYHGDNHNTTKLDSKLMNNGNNQEGIGIYFGSLETAESYGKNIVYLEINPKNFIESREPVKKHLRSKLQDILVELHNLDPEPLYYDCTDWGMEVSSPEDIEPYHLAQLAKNIENEEVRNFQIDMAEKFSVENFVKIWNKIYPNIYGTYHVQPNDTWYAVINTKLKLKKFRG